MTLKSPAITEEMLARTYLLKGEEEENNVYIKKSLSELENKITEIERRAKKGKNGEGPYDRQNFIFEE